MRRRLAITLVASAAVVAGCGPQAPVPVMHVIPSTDLRTGQNVTFDSTQQPGDPPDHTKDDTIVEWDLDGDGRFETTGRTVDTSYAQPGAYRVTLHEVNVAPGQIVVHLEAHGYLTKTVTVTAPPAPGNQAPTAAFDFSPNPGFTENAIAFDASTSSDPDGHILKYEWDWTADGTYDEESGSPKTKHAYPFAGTYTVRLRVTDDHGSTATTDRTVQVNDGVPPGKLIAREAARIGAAVAGRPFRLTLNGASISQGTTTVAGAKLLTAGIRAHGRMLFKKAPAGFAGHRSPHWAGVLSLVQRGSGTAAKLGGQGYVLLSLTKHDSLCLAGTASGGFTGAPFTGRLAAAGGKGFGARIRGTGTFSLPTTGSGTTVEGRLKLRRVHKPRGLPKACRKLVRDLPH